MNYIPEESQVVFQELPDYISLTFSITGCGKKCANCHSPHLQDSSNGEPLTNETLEKLLKINEGYIQAVIFFGGDLLVDDLIAAARFVKQFGLKVAVYSGWDSVDERILEEIDFVKYGAYIEPLGGLDSETTNQRMIEISTGDDITYKFKSKKLVATFE